jgi:uncharacterized protein
MTKDRIVLLDSLRGLGVLGILLCNMPDFAVAPPLSESVVNWPHGTGPATLGVWAVTQWLFQRKFVTLFAMLFGVSIFLVGGERSDLERGATLRKRLAWMVVFGLLHGFAIWFGDVLLSYALAGFAVMRARSWAPKKLIRTGVIIWVVFSLLMTAGMTAAIVFQHDATQATLETAKAIAKSRARRGPVRRDIPAVADPERQGPPRIPAWRALHLRHDLGPDDDRPGLLQAWRADRRGVEADLCQSDRRRPDCLGGHRRPGGRPDPAGLAAAAVDAVHGGPVDDRAADDPGLCRPDGLREPAPRVWSAIPKALAPVGQMAFTNYLTQSLIMTAIFYGGRGLALHGKVDRPGLAALTVATWVLQLLWSRWWMDRFEMGPLEWVWRRLYRGPTRLRRPKLEPVAA